MDGIKNLIEYAFRLDPTNPETLPFSLLVEENGEQTLELHDYEDTQIDDINYIAETSSTLAPDYWTTAGVTVTSGATTDGLMSKIAGIPVNGEPGFIRIRIERMGP